MDKSTELDSISDLDIEQYIIQLLKSDDKVTTKVVVAALEADGLTCPDEPVRFLNKLRMKGLIKGELSIEHKAWVWWV